MKNQYSESPEVIFRPCGGAEQIPAFATRRSEFLQGVEIGIIWTFELIAVTGGFRLSNVWPLHEQMYERDGLLLSVSGHTDVQEGTDMDNENRRHL